jgi:HK97 family phage major capsid protein
MTIKELREKRAGIVQRIKALADKLRDPAVELTAEERTQFDSLDAEQKKLEGRIADLKRAEELDAEMGRSTDDGKQNPGRENRNGYDDSHEGDERRDRRGSEVDHETRSLAVQGWMMSQWGRPVPEANERAMKKCLHASRGESDTIRLQREHGHGAAYAEGAELVIPIYDSRTHRRLRENRALGDNPMTITTTAGGYLRPEGFVYDLERAMLAFGNVMGVADVLRTASGNDLPWPSANDTGESGEASTINTAVAADAKPAIGRLVLKAYKYDSKAVYIPYELYEDSAFNIDAMISDMLGERLGRCINGYLTTGLGTTEPSGIVTGAYAGITAASATSITSNELTVDLPHSVDPAYRDPAQNCGYMMHDLTLAHCKKMVDGMGRILLPELRLPNPRLEGWPIAINQQMATIEADAIPILFGAFRKYKVRMVNQIRLRKWVENTKDQDAFVAYVRFDAGVLDAGTHPIRKLTMAS